MVGDFDTVCGVLLVSRAGWLPLFPYFRRFLPFAMGAYIYFLEKTLGLFRRMVVSTGVFTVLSFSKYAVGCGL